MHHPLVHTNQDIKGDKKKHLQEKTLYDLDLDVVTQNVQCPQNHMAYVPAKFEVATSNNLEGDTFTRKYIL